MNSRKGKIIILGNKKNIVLIFRNSLIWKDVVNAIFIRLMSKILFPFWVLFFLVVFFIVLLTYANHCLFFYKFTMKFLHFTTR
jgi:hypothetical protein